MRNLRGFTKIDTGIVVNLLIDTSKQEAKGSVRVALDGFGAYHLSPALQRFLSIKD